MSVPQPNAPVFLAWPARLFLIATAGGLLLVLAMAAVLSPDQRGYGTHEQLGLGACYFQTQYEIRCPSCGMTTAWSHLVRGELIASLRANVGGALLGLMAVAGIPWALVGAWRGRLWRPGSRASLGLVVTIVTVTFLDWAIRLIFHGS